jgi:hypothetical protein
MNRYSQNYLLRMRPESDSVSFRSGRLDDVFNS